MSGVCSLASKGTLDDYARSELNEINPTLGKSKAFSGLPSLRLITREFCAASIVFSSTQGQTWFPVFCPGCSTCRQCVPRNLSCSNILFYSASKCHLQTTRDFCYWQDLRLKGNFKIPLNIYFHFPKQHTLKKIIIPPQLWSVVTQIATMQTKLSFH